MVRWDRAVMSHLLGQPDVVATDLEKFLDDYLRDLDQKPVVQVKTDAVAFELVYFRWHDDAASKARKDRLTKWLAGK
jgi:hypothetical protein